MSSKFSRRSFLGSSLGTVALGGCFCAPPPSPDGGPADAGLFDANGFDANGFDVNGLDVNGVDANGVDANGVDAGTADVEGADVVSPGIDGLPEVSSDNIFPLGVQSGGARETSILLWGYTVNEIEENEVWIWREGEDEATRIDAPVDADGYTRVLIEDLEAFTEYRFAFVETNNPRRSTIGRFVTAPAEGESPVLRVACATCSNNTAAPWPVLSGMAQTQPDLFVHMGDMVYADGSNSVEDYRGVWQSTLSQQGYRDILSTTSALQSWDDHEFDNNIDALGRPNIVALGKEAFYQNTAQRNENDGQLWDSYLWGDTAEFIILDSRTERIASTRNGPDATYISEEQFAFMEDRLRNSPCRFKVLINSVPITRMPDIWLSQEDRWQGYAAQRDRLLAILEDDDVADGVLILSGDFHVGFVGHVQRNGIHRRLLEVAVGPTGNFNPLGSPFLRNTTLPSNQFDFATDELCGTILTFRPDTGEVDVQFTNAAGIVLYDETVQPGRSS